MRISPILAGATALLSLTCTVAATNVNHDNNGNDLQHKRHSCLTDHEANVLQWRWINFFTNFNPAIAEKSIADNFELFSESTNYLTPNFNISNAANPQYASKAAFIAGQSGTQHPGETPQQLFTVLASDHGCNSFTFRWTLNGNLPVAGIDFVFIAPDSYLIEKGYSEFNTMAILIEGGCYFVGGVCGLQDCAKGGCGPVPPK